MAGGMAWEDAARKLTGVAEGVATVRGGLALAAAHGVELPIAEQVAAVVHDGRAPMEAVAELMSRQPKGELTGLSR
jgi:glycerol-3-phosphate dehydrogenase (NAD(P)+)